MGEIVLITSGKGGVGKSTVTAQLGAALAKEGKSTVLIELDRGLRCLDILLGVEDQIVYDLSDVLEGRCKPMNALVQCSYQPGLHLLPAAQDSQFTYSAEALTALCKTYARQYQYVLIDTPAGLGIGFVAAAAACNAALLVVTPDPICVRDAAFASQLLERLGVLNQRLIINRIKERYERYEHLPDLDWVIDSVGVQLIGVVPEDGQLMTAIMTGGTPDKDFKAVKSFQNIAKRLLGQECPLLVR